MRSVRVRCENHHNITAALMLNSPSHRADETCSWWGFKSCLRSDSLAEGLLASQIVQFDGLQRIPFDLNRYNHKSTCYGFELGI